MTADELANLLFTAAERFWHSERGTPSPPRSYEHTTDSERDYWLALAQAILQHYTLQRR